MWCVGNNYIGLEGDEQREIESLPRVVLVEPIGPARFEIFFFRVVLVNI